MTSTFFNKQKTQYKRFIFNQQTSFAPFHQILS